MVKKKEDDPITCTWCEENVTKSNMARHQKLNCIYKNKIGFKKAEIEKLRQHPGNIIKKQTQLLKSQCQELEKQIEILKNENNQLQIELKGLKQKCFGQNPTIEDGFNVIESLNIKQSTMRAYKSVWANYYNYCTINNKTCTYSKDLHFYLLLKKKVKETTNVLKIRRILQHLIRELIQDPSFSVPKIKLNNAKKREKVIMSEKEINDLFKRMSHEEYYLVLKIQKETGVRISAAANVKYRNINFDYRIIYFDEFKTNKYPAKYVSKDLLDDISDYCCKKDSFDGYMFGGDCSIEKRAEKIARSLNRNKNMFFYRDDKKIYVTTHAIRRYKAQEAINMTLAYQLAAKCLTNTTSTVKNFYNNSPGTENDYSNMIARLDENFKQLVCNLPIDLNPDNLTYAEFIDQIESSKDKYTR
jgi:integrase